MYSLQYRQVSESAGGRTRQHRTSSSSGRTLADSERMQVVNITGTSNTASSRSGRSSSCSWQPRYSSWTTWSYPLDISKHAQMMGALLQLLYYCIPREKENHTTRLWTTGQGFITCENRIVASDPHSRHYCHPCDTRYFVVVSPCLRSKRSACSRRKKRTSGLCTVPEGTARARERS